MTAPLVVVRHGETDWNAEGRLQGQTDIPLNGRGRDQADAVGRTLKAALGDAAGYRFVASPLSRASETMRRLRAVLGLDPDAFDRDPRLKELSFGTWEGATFRELKRRDPASVARRTKAIWDFRPPEGESYADLSLRVGEAVDGLDGPTVLVAHGGVSRVLLALRGGVDRAAVPDMAIVQGRAIVFDDAGWRWTS
ncbi:putative phosphoglycerate mutase [Methylopila capsulata]|uniref:Phosphoglycerate mutase n=2 Tax=Methylopila capsulata TaxID=61654 RepID=A0ABS2T7T8_9HYPH|nr:histidine phosphatase family protein [Methylopila capsulata]MBM7852248.1 putative phosphoglycerate mutase [Methylopila capsulata]